MKAMLAFMILLTVGITRDASAQNVDGQTSGATLSTFEALPLVLKIRQQVKVREATGRTTRGTVVSICGDQLVISRQRFPLPCLRHFRTNFTPRRLSPPSLSPVV